MITGLNHLTLAVADLDRAFAFYTGTLGLRPVAKWARGAYLLAGDAWLCLALDPATHVGPLPEYTHYAFSVDTGRFAECAAALRDAGVRVWKDNRSEGESFYFLDPDGHKLELHVGDLASRLASLGTQPYEGLTLFDAR
jgi:catechol 2,3-dioxygenase-like lactoylglutathione lyase family enzyme